MTDAQRRGREQRREPIIIDVPTPAGADQLLTLLDKIIERSVNHYRHIDKATARILLGM